MEKFEGSENKSYIEYPYMPTEGEIVYTSADNEYLVLAKEFAREFSLDKNMPNASVIVRDGQVLGIGANGSNYHDNNGCERVRQDIPTGQGYELCEGCHPKNHGEQSAINNTLAQYPDLDLNGAEVYLWGHWWCCESCWQAMLAQGITKVYLVEGSERLFNRESPDNIIGHQFD